MNPDKFSKGTISRKSQFLQPFATGRRDARESDPLSTIVVIVT